MAILLLFTIVNSAFAINETDFIEICQKGTLAEVKEAVANGANPDSKVYFLGIEGQETPLYSAIVSGNKTLSIPSTQPENPEKLEIVRFLIKSGADVKFNARGKPYLTWAIMTSGELSKESPRLDIIEELIGAGADVNAKDRDGKTPMMVAKDGLKYGFRTEKIIDMLTKAGAKP